MGASQNLQTTFMFAVLGFILGGAYEPLRISRLFVRTSALIAGIEDFLFLAFCGVIVFAYSLEFGAGEFRYFYYVGLGLGGAVYFVTIGRLISKITRAFAHTLKSLLRKAARFVYKKAILPIYRRFEQSAQKSRAKFGDFNKVLKNRLNLLKNRMRIKYNENVRKNMIRERRSPKDVRIFDERASGGNASGSYNHGIAHNKARVVEKRSPIKAKIGKN